MSRLLLSAEIATISLSITSIRAHPGTLSATSSSLMLQSYLTPFSPINSRALGGLFTQDRFIDHFDSLFDSVFDSANSTFHFDSESKSYLGEIDLAGFKKDEVNVEVTEGVLTVKAESPKRGKVTRTFYASDVDAEKIDAKLEDGVLRLTLPLAQSALPKKIELK